MKNMIGPLAASLLLCACASTPQTPSETAAQQVAGAASCEYTVRTGSSIPSKRCFTAEEKEASRRAASELQDKLLRLPAQR